MAKSMQEAKENRGKPTSKKGAKTVQKKKRKGVRKPLSVTMNLDVPAAVKKKDHAYRWVRNQPERILMYEEAWWEIVKDSEGRPIQKSAKNPEDPEMQLILMETPLEYFEEDLVENRKKPVNLLKEKAKLKAGEYIPDDAKDVVTIKH